MHYSYTKHHSMLLYHSVYFPDYVVSESTVFVILQSYTELTWFQILENDKYLTQTLCANTWPQWFRSHQSSLSFQLVELYCYRFQHHPDAKHRVLWCRAMNNQNTIQSIDFLHICYDAFSTKMFTCWYFIEKSQETYNNLKIKLEI